MWLTAHFAAQSPGASDNLLLIGSTPVECARSRETVKRSALFEFAGCGYCASHSRFFWVNHWLGRSRSALVDYCA